jgi:hypothetical protein
MRSSQSVEFQLEPSSLGYSVFVRLRHQERWVALVDWRTEQLNGLGPTARAALLAALMPLGPRATATLMAEPAMFGASASLLASKAVWIRLGAGHRRDIGHDE